MRVVIDFRNPAADTLTVWTKVKLTYIVVSATAYEELPGDEALIWATNVEFDIGSEIDDIAGEAILQDDVFYGTDGTTGCGLTFDDTVGTTGYNFGVDCGETGGTTTNDVAVHAYIMGFQFNPDTADDEFLAASVDFSATAKTNVATAVASFLELATVGFNAAANRDDSDGFGVEIIYDGTGPFTDNVGPLVDIPKFQTQLETIKIGFVFTVLNVVATLDTNFNSDFRYSYSGLYNTVDTGDYNIQTIIEPSAAGNNLY
jgi:hypothetical protein